MIITDLEWLLLVFSLPSSRASERVEVWRKLQRYGALALRSSGYVLPQTAANQEKMEWLATAIRNYGGRASVVQARAFDDLPPAKIRQLFVEERSRDYEALLRELKNVVAPRRRGKPGGKVSRLRRRFQEIRAIDFFESPLRKRVESLLQQADEPAKPTSLHTAAGKAREYRRRVWMTRPRPGIDRVSSAWLIRRFIDPKARFVFGNDPGERPKAVPFDMFSPLGFGHRGEDCTFETLCKEFAIHDSKVKRIAQIVHDADFGDEKFGRDEGQGLEQVLNGWERQDLADHELLDRGMELIEGLYQGIT